MALILSFSGVNDCVVPIVLLSCNLAGVVTGVLGVVEGSDLGSGVLVEVPSPLSADEEFSIGQVVAVAFAPASTLYSGESSHLFLVLGEGVGLAVSNIPLR